MLNHVYLGYDGGGTKTDCVLLGDDGAVLAESRGGPANPMRVGFDAAFAALRDCSERVLAAASAEASQVAGVCAGLAGCGRKVVADRVATFLREQFPRAVVHATSDSMVALEAATDSGPGVVIIAGTGSVVLGRNAAGEVVRAGGYGPWIGDEGSGYDVGRRAVIAVARARDELGPATRLSELLLRAMEVNDWPELVGRIAAGADQVYPRLYPVVVGAAEEGDAVAREILVAAATALAELAVSVIRRLNFASEEFILAKSGGVFGRTQLFDGPLDERLAQGAPRARIEALRMPPAMGAARLARRLAARAGDTAHGATH